MQRNTCRGRQIFLDARKAIRRCQVPGAGVYLADGYQFARSEGVLGRYTFLRWPLRRKSRSPDLNAGRARFDVGVTVVAEGEPGCSMYIVRSGELVVSKLGGSGRALRMTGLGPGDFFGEMTLIEMQNRSATVVADSPTVLYELTARNLYTYYKADIHAYVMVMQNINRELCRRLRRADNRIAELADASRESMTQNRVRPVG